MISDTVMIAIALKEGKMMRRKEFVGKATSKDAKEKINWGDGGVPDYDTVIVYPKWQEEAYLRAIRKFEP